MSKLDRGSGTGEQNRESLQIHRTGIGHSSANCSSGGVVLKAGVDEHIADIACSAQTYGMSMCPESD